MLFDDRTYVNVILPLYLEWEPFYYVPAVPDEDSVKVGDRVLVAFANRRYVGVVSAAGVEPDAELVPKIKPIVRVERAMRPISTQELSFWRFIADYYMCTVGDVYKAACPPFKISMELSAIRKQVRSAEMLEREKARLTGQMERVQKSIDRRIPLIENAKSEKTKARYAAEREKFEAQKREIGAKLAALLSSNDGTACGEMPGNGETAGDGAPVIGGEISLSGAQNDAVAGIRESFNAGKPVLLHGVTGSGKTEIYINLAIETLKRGKNVLYLVPEIVMSHQLETRLRKLFGDILYTFHSRITHARRHALAVEVSRGRFIVLGTRSALFLPFHDLGLVIVDEEHDNSYKQTEPTPRYNGRDAAVALAKLHNANVILGSATPSLESLYNCKTGRFGKVVLKERYFGASDARIEIIDTVAERRKRGMTGSFSYKLIERINETLLKGEQVLILRDRRSYSPSVQCSECGDIPKCPHCNVPLSYHSSGSILLCHYCGWRTPYTGSCQKCGKPLRLLGAGTQKVEEEARSLFPMARVARLDSDTNSIVGQAESVIRDFSRKQIDILVGTQVIAKGLDFADLSLVVVLQADSLLGQQDFRADENAFHLLEQFRGRSGRRGTKGCLIIQTAQPGHPMYQSLACGAEPSSEATYEDSLLSERYTFGYPPFARIVNLIMKDVNEDRLDKSSQALSSSLRSAFGLNVAGFVQAPGGSVSVLGPYSPVVDKQSDKFIRIIRVTLRKDSHLSENKRKLAETVKAHTAGMWGNGNIMLDVDPV